MKQLANKSLRKSPWRLIISVTLLFLPSSVFASSPDPLFSSDFGKAPTYINSAQLTLHSEERTFEYSGNVEVRQGDFFLSSSILEGKYDEQNQIEELVAKGNVVITKGPDIYATGERGVYTKASETITLTESPELKQKESILTADRIIIFLNENRSVAEGQVRVKLAPDPDAPKSNGAGRRQGTKNGKSPFFK